MKIFLDKMNGFVSFTNFFEFLGKKIILVYS